MKSVFTLIFSLLFSICSFATNYYLSASGSDNANGLSIATAWRTVSKLNTVRLFPGDIVRFEGGVTFPGSIIVGPDDYGTAAQPVVITSYGAGRALIDAGTSVGILVINTGGVEISNINFMGGTGNDNAGVYITMDRTDSTLQHIVVQDVEVSRFYNYGVLISSNNTTKGYKDILINRVLSHDNLNGGMLSIGSGDPAFIHQNITVSNSKAYNNKGIPGYPDNTGNGIVLTGVDGALVDNCEAYNNGESNSYGGGGPVGIWFGTVKNGFIQNSESHHNKTGTIDGGGFDLDGGCQNSVIQYCYSHDNEGPGYLMAEYGSVTPYRDNIIRYNISENDGTDLRTGGNGGIYLWGGGTGLEVTNSQIYNNTIYTLEGRASLVLSDINFINVKISNNIFFAPANTRFIESSGDIDSTKAHLIHNNYYTTSTPEFKWGAQSYSSLAAWKAAAPTQERRGNVNYGLTVNPLLTAPGTGKDGYRLNNASPLINAGLNLANCGPRDYYGGLSKVGGSQDIGAYEKQDAPGDTEAPSVPTALNALYTGRTFVHLDWGNSTDNVGVTSYDVYVGGVKKYSTTESAITADSLTAGTAYSFTVKALDLAGNSSAFSTAASATTPTTANGLNYRYYEGGWNTLPNFNALTPVKTGLSPNTDLSIRNKNDSFAVVWEGTINIVTPGSYTFETVSDEGSRFYFNSVYKPGAVPLVNNDSLHTARSVSATINIPAAGMYPVAITYFEKTATESMQVFYTGPGVARQLIPNTSFNPPPPGDTEAPSVPTALNALYTGRTFVHLDWSNSTDNVGVTSYDVYVGGVKKYSTTESAITADSLTAGTAYSFTVKALDLAGNSSAFSTAASATTPTTANGLNYRYYEGGWNTLPNFNALTPVKTGLSPNTDLSIRNKNDSFAVVWEGTINIVTPGSYTFETVSDEGSRFYFNSVYKPGAVPLVNNDSLHTARSVSATINIPAAGMYPVAITYFEKTATESMQVFYTGPGVTRQLIPNTSFNPPPPGDTEAPSVPTALNALYTGRTFVHLDWSNSTDNVGVTSYDVYVGGVKKYSTTESAITADSLTAGTAYSFTVKALDLAGNSSAFSTAASATTPTTANGLNYRYYEGGWNTLPNFNALTPVKTGLSPNTDLSIRNKNDSFAVVWEGTINIVTPGSYTFETVSDEGSRFYFNSVYKPGAVPLVNNDSLHTARSVSATINIPAAGMYPVAITYFEKTATESMQVFYTGPGVTRQLIPNTSFNPPPPGDTEAPSVPTALNALYTGRTFVHLDWSNSTDNVGVTSYDVYVGGVKKYSTTESAITADSLTAGTAYSFTVKALDLAGNSSAFSTAASATTPTTANGLNYRYYEGGWNTLPNFNALTPVKTGLSPNTDLSIRNKNDSFAVVWEGTINIVTPGSYTFETVSDEGSRFYFNSVYKPGAVPLVNNDSLHTARSVSATINIPAAGMYPVAITYFEKTATESMQVFYTGPGVTRQLIPNTSFNPPPPGDTEAPSVPANLQVVSATSTSINLDWNDATDNVGVTGYDIYVGGVKRYTSTASQVTADGLTAATSYSFTVKALDLAGNSSAFSAAVTGSTTTASSSNGLNYRYYEGSWSVLPNFNTLTPVKTGTTANIDLSVRTAGVNDNYGFVWEGYINITAPGNYTFETISDDGSRFYFNTLYSPTATALVNNDGLHAPASVSGTVNIPAAGVYPVSITFFEKDGGETMQLYWTGPGIARQLVPNSAFIATPPADNVPPGVPANLQVVSATSTSINLDWNDATDNIGVTGYDIYVGGVKRYTSTASQVTADGLTAGTSYTFTVKALDLAGNSSAFSAAVTGTTSTTSNGLNYRYYEGSWSVLPNFNTLTPVKTGTTANIDLSVRTAGVNDNFAFVWEGYINITAPGNYTFETISDDGSRFYFNTLYSPTAAALVNNDGMHAPASVSGTVNIPAAGVYPVSITFFEKDGGETMQLYWSGPGITRQLVPNAAFIATPPADNVPPGVPANLQVVSATSTSINLDWNDATDNVGVTGYDIYVGGVKRYTSTASQVTADGLTAATSYTFTVKALDLAGNSSAFSAAVTGSTTTASSSNGLNYRYYEGSWSVLPNFNTLTPVKTGTTANIDLSVRTAGVNDNYGFVWEGYINITAPGNYTFETISDDGSRFYFNTLYSPTATALVNNDGLHAPASVSGTVNIPAAGVYPVSITFFEKDGGETMQLYWTGPGIARQLVPNSAFTGVSQPDNIPPGVPANLSVISTTASTINLDWNDATDNVGVTGYDIYVGGIKRYTSTASEVTADGLVAGTSYTFTVKALDLAGNSSAFSAAITGTTSSSFNGLNYRYYHGGWDVLPNFNALTPVKTGTSPNIDLSIRNRNDSFGVVWEGYINITAPGNYTFETVSDDGSRFYFNTFYSPTATALVNNDGLHAPASAFGTVNIPAAGMYPVSITFFEKDGGETMQLYWTGPGITRQLVPTAAFTSGSGSLISGLIQNDRDADASSAGSTSVIINKVYPNPYNQSFSIDLYNPTGANDIRVGLYDLKGKLIQLYHPGNLAAGNTTLNINVKNTQLAEGIYLVRVDVNGLPSKIIKLIKAKK